MAESSNESLATFAAGCFWGVEHVFRKKFGNNDGFVDVKVGYTGDDAENPTYQSVCKGENQRKFLLCLARRVWSSPDDL